MALLPADFKPLLAGKLSKGAVSREHLDKLRYPLLASKKIDGIRCINHPTLGPVARSLKPIPNIVIREQVRRLVPIGLDGELMTYDTRGRMDEISQVSSKVMSRDGDHIFKFHAFDDPGAGVNESYANRLNFIRQFEGRNAGKIWEYIPQIEVFNAVHAWSLFEQYLDEGYEGLMVRCPDGRYKFGRSSAREQLLLKVKLLEDCEGTIVAVEELYRNLNEATTNELGYTQRSTSKAGKVPGGVMGALVVAWRGVEFDLGSGFTDADRAWFWENREAVIGRLVGFKYQGIGSQNKPRHAVYRSLRDGKDMGG